MGMGGPSRTVGTEDAMRKMGSLVRMAALAAALLGIAVAAEQGEFVGQQLPELKLRYLENAPELQGKAVLLEFWATWCPPCRKSIPHLNELHEKYGTRGLVIIGVTNESRGEVKKFLKEQPIHYHVAFDDGTLARHFKVRGIPHAFLADATGRIVWHGHPMALRPEMIEKVLPR